MQTFSTFFAMGGYASFVWPAYGIAAVVVAGLLVASRRALGAREREIAALEAAMPRRRGAGSDEDESGAP